jgi:hypothetical protein
MLHNITEALGDFMGINEQHESQKYKLETQLIDPSQNK